MIIKYDPKKIINMSKFLNDNIELHKNEKYIMFIFNDIYENIINLNEFYTKYVKLMKRFDLPYAFYPYYLHFNKMLWRSLSIASPKMKIKIDKKPACNVINQAAYGMLIVDIEKIKSINFKFNESLKLCFYIQDLAEACFKHNLYFSSSSFLDVYNSQEMVKSSFKDGYFIDAKEFAEEKSKFYAKNTVVKEDVNEFIKKLKEKCQAIKESEKNTVELIEPDLEPVVIDMLEDK